MRKTIAATAVMTALAAGLIVAPTANAATNGERVTKACAALKAGDPTALDRAVDAWGRSGVRSEDIVHVKAGNITAGEYWTTAIDAKGNSYTYVEDRDYTDPAMDMAFDSANVGGVDYSHHGKKWKAAKTKNGGSDHINSHGLYDLIPSDSGRDIADYTVVGVNSLGVTELRHGDTSVIYVGNDCRGAEYLEEVRHGGTDEAPDATYIRRTLANVEVAPINAKSLARGRAFAKGYITPQEAPAVDTSASIPKDAA